MHKLSPNFNILKRNMHSLVKHMGGGGITCHVKWSFLWSSGKGNPLPLRLKELTLKALEKLPKEANSQLTCAWIFPSYIHNTISTSGTLPPGKLVLLKRQVIVSQHCLWSNEEPCSTTMMILLWRTQKWLSYNCCLLLLIDIDIYWPNICSKTNWAQFPL